MVSPEGWTELGPHDEMVPVPPTGCVGCLQDSGTKLLTWKYVGEGQGTFQPVQSYNYVGQGRGSFAKEVVITPGRWDMKKVLMCVGVCSVILALSVLGFLAYLGMRAGSVPGVRQPATAAGTGNGRNFDCNNGLDNWVTAWEQPKKDWCCAHENKGCKPPEQGCSTDCTYMKKTASCKFRIQWGATHRFLNQPGACQQAYNMVLGQCPFCHSCALADANCDPNMVLR
jgi:hypothetical protein